MKPLYERIRNYRKSKGITQVHISKVTGIDNKRLSFIENGNVELRAEEFVLIVEKGFELDVSFFLNIAS